MVYNSQRGRGFNDIFGTLNRTFKPVIEGAADVGANLATGWLVIFFPVKAQRLL